MKNYLIVGLACLVAALVLGVEPLERVINESMNRGSLRGVEKCIAYSKSELLSDSAVKATCTRTFHKRFFIGDDVSGRSGPKFASDAVSWGGAIENNTSSHVITWIEISAVIYDADGTEQIFPAAKDLWIDPMDEAEFVVEVPELKRDLFNNIGSCVRDDEEPKSCWDWGISDIMGVAI